MRKFQGAQVPHLALSLPGAHGLESAKSSYLLSQFFERHVRTYIYPALQQPPPDLSFSEQFAFRPTGSTTVTLLSFLHSISTMLTECPYAHVIALGSKAFDTVRHICYRRWPDCISRMKHTTGSETSSMATHTVRSSAQRHLRLLTLWPVSSRAHPLDQPQSLLQLLTYVLFSPATSSLNSLTIPTWSYLHPTLIAV